MSLRPHHGLRARPGLRLALATAVTASLTGGLLSASAGASTAAPASAAPATAQAAKPAKAAQAAQAAQHTDDFNGDGLRDYALTEGGGSVTVYYGTAKGPGSKKHAFDQNSPGIPGVLSKGSEGFGTSITTADFNNDGYGDLATADSTEKVGKHAWRGMVVIVWGSKSGLGSRATALPVTASFEHKRLGHALAAGDFDGDGKADLAVTTTSNDRMRPAVHIYRGGFSSVKGTTGKVTEHTPGHQTQLMETGALVAGKVTRDKATDLYVLGQGYANDRVTSGVWFLRGGSTVKSAKPTTYNAASANYRGEGVIADFDKDGYGDLAIGDERYNKYAGAVQVLRGGPSGPGSSYRVTQGTEGVATAASPGDSFGVTVSAADTDRDGYADLAVGTFETIGKVESAGGVHLLRGGKKGLTGTGSQWFTRDTPGIPDTVATAPRAFGHGVRLRDTTGDGHADLVINDWGWESTLLHGTARGVTTGKVTALPFQARLSQ
ncbi:VCBS repeat-containing protein [Streptomyces sp. NPDC000594]|uniref:FG-GAP repeat domain-containing protein n=1 Tax=Streptomyces sp. NPDC000594 TaxID=3154261 RepID=UPI0033312723